MGNKFFVSIELGLFTEIFMFILMVACACMLAFMPTTTPLNEDITLLIILIIMLFVLPIIIMILILFICFPKIEVTAEGMTKYLFGVKLKSYKWEEITEVKTYGNIAAQTISFYKNRKENSMFYKIKKKERIFIYCSEKKIKIIKHFAPDFIIEQLDKKI